MVRKIKRVFSRYYSSLRRRSFLDLVTQSALFIPALVVFAVTFVGFWTPWYYHIYRQWEWALYFLTLPASYALAKKLHLAAWPAIFAACLSAAYTFHNPESFYKSLDPFDYFYATRQSAITLICALLFLLALSVLQKYKSKFFIIYRAIGVIGAFMIFYQTYMDYPPDARGAMMGNASMGACLLVMTLPFQGIFASLLIAASVFCTKATVPLLAMAAYVIGRLGKWGLLLATLSLIIGGMIMGPEMLGSSGRTHVWREAIDYYFGKPVWVTTGPVIDATPFPKPNLFLGTGLGTAQAIIPRLQIENYAHRNELFLWFHNDILQFVFETGLLGLFGLAVLIIALFSHAYFDKKKLGALLLLGTVAFFNFPVHIFSHAFLMGLTLLWILEEPKI